MSIKSRYRELSKENIAWYVESCRFNIQDEVGMLKIESVKDTYLYALKTKDNFKRKSQVNYKGKEKLDNSTQAK